MKTAMIAVLLSVASFSAMADDQANCQAAGGSYLTGVVTGAPYFKRASETLQGVKLSHTHVTITADQDGNSYDVAMDNVYAVDFVKNSSSMPKSLAAIKVGNHLELCGELYTSGSLGIHWVHDNCNTTPSSSNPNGWASIVTNGVVGVNLERSQSYCYLWGEN
jgi:hypothetical protein